MVPAGIKNDLAVFCGFVDGYIGIDFRGLDFSRIACGGSGIG